MILTGIQSRYYMWPWLVVSDQSSVIPSGVGWVKEIVGEQRNKSLDCHVPYNMLLFVSICNCRHPCVYSLNTLNPTHTLNLKTYDSHSQSPPPLENATKVWRGFKRTAFTVLRLPRMSDPPIPRSAHDYSRRPMTFNRNYIIGTAHEIVLYCCIIHGQVRNYNILYIYVLWVYHSYLISIHILLGTIHKI